MAGWIKMPLGMEVVLSPGDFVLDGDSALPSTKRIRPKRYCIRREPSSPSPCLYCGQTAGWIKMAFGTEMGLGPGHIVLDGDPRSPPRKGAEPPNFRPMSIVGKRLDG